MTEKEIFNKSLLVSEIPDVNEYEFFCNYKEYSIYKKKKKDEYVKVNLENGTLIL